MNKGTVVFLGGSGGVGSVALQKALGLPQIFKKVISASRNTESYQASERLSKALYTKSFNFYRVDASQPDEMKRMLRHLEPELLVNVGIPYWNLIAMQACLETGTNYLDTACYEPEDEAHFRHAEQWAFADDFRRAGLVGVIGCGFDPGVTNAMVAHGRTFFSKLDKVQIWDCNGGDHGKTFASNFNLALNLRELLGMIRFWRDGQWAASPSLINPHAVHHPYIFEEIGERELYLLYHEELESLARRFPDIPEMSFWMTFGPKYLQCLRMFVDLGLTSIKSIDVSEKISPFDFLRKVAGLEKMHLYPSSLLAEIGLLLVQPIKIESGRISPLEFLQKVLPDPASLGQGYSGKTNIGVICEGLSLIGKQPKKIRLYNICDHAECFREVGSQAVSYTTGVPAMCGAAMILSGVWRQPGVWNVEDLAVDHFLDMVHRSGLPIRMQWQSDVPESFVL